MSIRVRFRNGSWWAYFNGAPASYLHAESLDDLCVVIGTAWPKQMGVA